MKAKSTMFQLGGVYYMQDSTTGKQTSLRTKDETEVKSLLNARNEAQRQPVLNLHLARAYLTASDLAFVERTWQTEEKAVFRMRIYNARNARSNFRRCFCRSMQSRLAV